MTTYTIDIRIDSEHDDLDRAGERLVDIIEILERRIGRDVAYATVYPKQGGPRKNKPHTPRSPRHLAAKKTAQIGRFGVRDG